MDLFYRFSALIFGLLVGSFINVLILRLPEKKDIVFKSSHCRHCGKSLKWWMNIPVLSYLLLRGKCHYCKGVISWRYPFVELLTALASYFLFPQMLTGYGLLIYGFYFAVFCLLIALLFIDIDHMILPDSLNVILLALLLAFSVYKFPLAHWLFGGALGFLIPLLITWLFYQLRGQIGLGGGDIKLYGILGIYLGPIMAVKLIFYSCFLGALVGLLMMALKKMKKNEPMAFGPAIIVMAIFQIYFPKYLVWLPL